MDDVPESSSFSFPAAEDEILAWWDEVDAFQEQLRRTEGNPPFVFYDGPPFATGLPHYGHLLAGTIKDVVTRFASATGRHVPRRFGWDCHGLPVEHEIDKSLGITSRQDVLDMGIKAYNDECRKIVMRYSSEWRATVRRSGRWIDFDNDYKTLDTPFMESVWWVFQRLHEKGLVYRGYKVMPFSTACGTPLSNFEAGLNYKDVADPAVMVAFPLVGGGGHDGASMVAWTTTPWTLPSNLALCVHPALTYVKVRCRATGAVYIVAEARAGALPGAGKPKKAKGGEAGAPAAPSGYETLATMTGADLVGARYAPLFPYFAGLASVAGGAPAAADAAAISPKGAFRVLADAYVTADSGTGVVHCAPAFGEDDMRVCIDGGVVARGGELPCPVDGDGRFTAPVSDFVGRHVKDADKDVVAAVKAAGRLVGAASVVHSYPFCWRSDTPLIYRAVPSWFVRVEAIKDRLLVANAGTAWVPGYVKDKRFHNWLESARDWAVSRSRFWGTPLPVWTSADGSEVVVVGSVAELEARTGATGVTDLHRHHVDGLEIPSATPGAPPLKRVDDVFDCWFESGAMPYASVHYPFEAGGEAALDGRFPADFVAEGLDQTRGWFYTLMVLSTALFDKPAFKNLVCNGLVLAADGKKMSKRLQNYPDPTEVLEKHGADALRLYLVNSPVVRAEPLRFRVEGVFGVVKDVFLPWYNAYRFLVQSARRLEAEAGAPFAPDAAAAAGSGNVLDRWLHAETAALARFVRTEMGAYRLYTVVPRLTRFINDLTNVYVRYNRVRMKGKAAGDGGERAARAASADRVAALSTLHATLTTLAVVMAPFTPFLCEVMWRNLRKALPEEATPRSVHWASFPDPPPDRAGDDAVRAGVSVMQAAIELARTTRERAGKPLRQPLSTLTLISADPALLAALTPDLEQYVREEANVVAVVKSGDVAAWCETRLAPDWPTLGARLGKALPAVKKGLAAADAALIAAIEAGEAVTVGGARLEAGDVRVVRAFKPTPAPDPARLDGGGDGSLFVALDLTVDDALAAAGLARDVVTRVQKARKTAGLVAGDPVDVWLGGADAGSAIGDALAAQGERVAAALGGAPRAVSALPAGTPELLREAHVLPAGEFVVVLTRP